MELVWRKELRVFGNQQQISMAAQQNKTKTQKSIRKLYPTLNHKSSKCLPTNILSSLNVVWEWLPTVCKTIILFLFLYVLPTVEMSNLEWQASESYSKVCTDLFQAKQEVFCDHTLIIHMPFDMCWCYFITAQGLVCHFLPFLPLSCLKMNGCTNFVLLLTFLRHWWRNLSGGKVSYEWINFKSQDI